MSRRILIGIAGGSGSGKTLVARTIVRELGSKRVVVIDQDSYYRNLEQIPFRDREARNFDHPDAFDHDLLHQHLRELLEGHAIDQPVYDYAKHERASETRRISDHVVVVLEGSRSVDSILRQYEDSVRPMHLQFVEPSKRFADVIIPGGGHNKVAIDLVKTKIRELLRERGVDATTALPQA